MESRKHHKVFLPAGESSDRSQVRPMKPGEPSGEPSKPTGTRRKLPRQGNQKFEFSKFDAEDFWAWRQRQELPKRVPKNLTPPKVPIKIFNHKSPEQFFKGETPSYYDFVFLKAYRKDKRRAERKLHQQEDEWLAQEMAKARINEERKKHTPKEKVKKKRKRDSTVGGYSLIKPSDSVNYSQTGQARQQRSIGSGIGTDSGTGSGFTRWDSGKFKFGTSTIDMPCRCDAWRDKDTAPGWHCQSDRCEYRSTEATEATEASATEDEDEKDVQDDQVEQEDEEEELTHQDMQEIKREETDKYMRQKVNFLLKYDPMHIIRRRQDNMINDQDDDRIRTLTRNRILAEQGEIAKRREMAKEKKQARERIIYRGPRYYEGPTLSYESDNQHTSENDSEETEEDSPENSEAETTEGETDAETTYEETEEETDAETTYEETEEETDAETTYEETEEETEAETETDTPYEETEAETSQEASEADTEASATEASEASASEADYSGYES